MEKIYKHHSGYIGGLKEVPITRMRERRPEEVSWVWFNWVLIPLLCLALLLGDWRDMAGEEN